MPVFGGGLSRFQPVFVGDIARLVELCSHTENAEVSRIVQGKILEAGGPDGESVKAPSPLTLNRFPVFTYRQIMELVLKYTGRRRPIVSAPFWVGKLQGAIFEQLPENVLSISRDQVSSVFVNLP
jgi:NADH dehydrogenase